MTIQISAIVCTYNRSSYLRRALESLRAQSLASSDYEILVVDNRSTDDTRDVVTRELAAVTNLRYLYEPVQGLSQARNTGWKAASAPYVAFLDDDAVASADWLDRILRAFSETHPSPGVVGGRIEPIWEGLRPPWLSDTLAMFLGVLDLSPEPKTSHDVQMFAGANVAFPQHVLAQCGGFSTQLGRKGKRLLSNEEIYLWTLIRNAGLSCLYDPRVHVRHHIHADRLSQKWFVSRMYWEGVSEGLMAMMTADRGWTKKARRTASSLRSLFRPRHRLLDLLSRSADPQVFQRQCFTWHQVGVAAANLGLA